ncbi:MAG: YggS family pyridoxal phosphate-dependent enzyme [Saprospiraceae bacterium]
MLEKILNDLRATKTELIAVSKTKPAEQIEKLYQKGQRHFGENYVQEIIEKARILPQDIHWHFIGHLQSNKVKSIVPFVHLIHTLDSLSLLSEIDKQGKKNTRRINCLLQFKINDEETKFGLEEADLESFLGSVTFQNTTHVNIIGVMGMSTFTDDKMQVRREFQHLKSIFENLKKTYFKDKTDFSEISMGMSDDYLIAIEEGSTMVRIGSLLFGKRE